MKKPSPTTIIYHTEAGYHSQEVCYHLVDKPEVDKPLIINRHGGHDTRAIPKHVHLYMLGAMMPKEYPCGPTPIYNVFCEIPDAITVTMGCGHTQTVPNDPGWVMADGASNTKCEACWKEIAANLYEAEEYNASNCYEDYYGF